LQIPWSQVYDLSCRLEHATDDEVTEALADFLGNPEVCPHGHPIPDKQGRIEIPPAIPLSNTDFDQEVIIARIDQPELILCEHLEERGLFPGTTLMIIDEAPFNGPFTLSIDGEEITLGREISSRILVQPK
jgi:DtxR family Mn-dependent transcriptional regulator